MKRNTRIGVATKPKRKAMNLVTNCAFRTTYMINVRKIVWVIKVRKSTLLKRDFSTVSFSFCKLNQSPLLKKT